MSSFRLHVAVQQIDLIKEDAVPDSVVQGLFIYLGVHRTSWIYKKWARVKGKLKSREKTIGHWPALSAPAARIEALKEAATFASGTRASLKTTLRC
jgi:hypothetical protein